MNGFFTNLIDRHLGACDTIQPRTLGRFEMDHGSMSAVYADEGTAPVVSENDQTLQTPSESSVESPTVAKHMPDSIEKRNDVSSPGKSSVDLPTVAKHKPDPIENRNDIPSPSHPDQNNAQTKFALTEDNTAHFDSHVLPLNPQDTQSLVADMQLNRGAVKRDQLDKAALVDDKNYFTNIRLNTNINKLDEVIRETNPLPTLGEYVIENELNHRIDTMLKRLTNDPVSPTTSPDQDNLSSHNNEIQMPILPGTELPLSDPAVSSLDMAPASSRQAAREEDRSPKDRVNTLHSQLEPPSWLLDMESQFSLHSQQKAMKAEPVINVTIGRVEVRAVQTETPRITQHTKKPTGVMTLDDYLKRREERGSR